MSADDLICKAFDKGWNAGLGDRGRAECPFAPFTQEDKWLAWMIGYEETYERYAIAAAVRSTETRSRLGPQGRQSVIAQNPPHSLTCMKRVM